MKKSEMKFGEFDVAVIGMAGQFPNAQSIEEYWENIKAGKDCITRNVTSHKSDYVNAYGKLKDIYKFDASFFDISDYEAMRMDPQHRKLLECVYLAMDDAGYAKREEDKFRTGIFCSADEPYYVWEDYFLNGVYDEYEASTVGLYTGSALSSRISYKLNLTGPSVVVRAACATSLVSIHMACQSLLGYESDMAIVAASNIALNQDGYFATENTISPDGYTRAYDNNGQGFVPGNGTAAIILKRLSDATRDKDHIYAVIKGSSIGNDGNRKIGYTAPSVEGEREVILQATEMAGISTKDIGYIEGHGTATPLGDAIELKALKSIMEKAEDNKPYCAIGSVKSNIGHLNMSAGIAGFIKAVLCVKDNVIPPSLHCEEWNKELMEAGCPLYIADKDATWNEENVRIAGVSSFGIGGINAHIIVQEPPKSEIEKSKDRGIIPYSAKSIESLTQYREKLLGYLQNHENDLAVISGMYKNHKPYNRYRDYILWDKNQSIYEGDINATKQIKDELFKESKIVFMFPGGGSQVADMGQNLYSENAVFRKYMDDCFSILESKEGINFKEKMQKKEPINESSVLEILSMIFSVDYSLAMLLQECGIKPDYVLGSSLGEYAASCVAGVISLEDALKMITSRGKLFETIPDGSMLTVSAPAFEVEKYLTGENSLSISAINSDKRTLVSGLDEEIQQFKNELKSNGIVSIYLKAGKAGHCSLVDPILEQYEESISDIVFSDMKLPVFSSYAGRKVSNEEISKLAFWRNHMREPVRFFDAVSDLPKDENIIFIETGMGNQLSSFVRKILEKNENKKIIPMISNSKITEYENVLKGIGEIWRCGKSVNWMAIDEINAEELSKVSVPEYVFDGKEYRHGAGSRLGNVKSTSCVKNLIIDGLTEENYQRTKYILNNNSNQCILVEDEGEKNKIGFDNVKVEKIMKALQSEFFHSKEITLLSEILEYDKTMRALMVSCIADYLKKHLTIDGKESYTLSEFYKILDIKEEFYAFFNYLIDVLREEKLAEVINGKIYFSEQINELKTAEEQLVECKENCEEFEPLAKLCIYTSSFFEEVFTGRKRANEVIYPEGKYDMLASVYDQLPMTTYRYECIDVLGQLLQKIIENNNRKLRILEIGAGTGEMTEVLMSKIGNDNIEYWFTDIGASFLSYGQEGKLSQYKNIKYNVFDISKKASKQGIPENYFDIVVGFDVVQATESIDDALYHLRDVLIPGGMISLIQTYVDNPVSYMIYGMSPGWWNFTKDPIRGSKIILEPDEWVTELQKTGFMNVQNYPEQTDISDAGIFIAFKENKLQNEARLFVNEEKEQRYNNLLSITQNIPVVFVNCNSKEQFECELQKKGYVLDEYECVYPEAWKVQEEDISNNVDEYDEITKEVVQLLKEVLGEKSFELHTPFEDLGLDSLSGLILISRLKSKLHQKIGVDVLYQNNTAELLSVYIKENIGNQEFFEDNQIEQHKEAEKSLLDLLEEN